jgi:hypothetical protein
MANLGRLWGYEVCYEVTLRGVGSLKERNTTVMALKEKDKTVWKALVGYPEVSQQGVGEIHFWGVLPGGLR